MLHKHTTTPTPNKARRLPLINECGMRMADCGLIKQRLLKSAFRNPKSAIEMGFTKDVSSPTRILRPHSLVRFNRLRRRRSAPLAATGCGSKNSCLRQECPCRRPAGRVCHDVGDDGRITTTRRMPPHSPSARGARRRCPEVYMTDTASSAR